MLAWLPVVLSLTSVAGVPNPRDRDSWVTDLAGVLDPAAEDRIDAAIDALHADIGVEVAVVTVDDVAGPPHDFAVELGNHWGVGQAATDNGLLILLVTGQRRLEIATGSGMETVLSDRWLGDMQVARMVPHFKRGDFGAGLEAGVAAIAEQLRTGPAEDPAAVTGTTAQPSTSSPEARWRAQGERQRNAPPADGDSDPPWTLIAALGLGVPTTIGGGVLARRAYWRKISTCETCQILMNRLDEVADDAHLDAGQKSEERLGSVNYIVLVCPTCQASKTVRRGRWFSGYGKCSACAYKTSTSSSETLVSATYDHGGQVRVTVTCHHCNHSSSYTRSTPKLTPPSSSTSSSSSSSSSSGSSFGGGSFGGGGSGSSW